MTNSTGTYSHNCETTQDNRGVKGFSFTSLYWILILSSFLLVQCNSSSTSSGTDDKTDWENAKKENTLSAYDSYLEKYPRGEFASKAKTEEAKILIEEAKTGNPIESYDKYAKRFPNGKNKSLFDPLVYNYILKQDSVEMFDLYIERFPDGQYSGQFEQSVFDKVRKGNSSMDFSDFVAQYPNSNYIMEIDSLLFDSVKRYKTPAVYEEYLTTLPNGIHRPEVDSAYEKMLYSKAVTTNSAGNFNKYSKSKKIKKIKVETQPSGQKIDLYDIQDSLWKRITSPVTINAIEGTKFIIKINNPKYNKVNKTYEVTNDNNQVISETLREPFKPVVTEEFNGSSSIWSINGKKDKSEIKNGTLICTVSSKQFQKLEKLNIDLNKDFEIEIKYKVIATKNKYYRSYFGIVWGDENKAKFIFVAANGKYNYGEQSGNANPDNNYGYPNWDNYSPDSDNWTITGVYKPNDFNTLKVVKTNKQIKYYLNGKYLRFENSMTKYKGNFAGFGLGNITVQIDYIHINQLL